MEAWNKAKFVVDFKSQLLFMLSGRGFDIFGSLHSSLAFVCA